MEQMIGYALLGIDKEEIPEMMHTRVQEAYAMALKMLQNSIGTVEYKGKTMEEWVKSIKELQQYEEHLREATKKIEQLQAERDAAVAGLKSNCICPECNYFSDDIQDPCRGCKPNASKFEWRGVQKEK